MVKLTCNEYVGLCTAIRQIMMGPLQSYFGLLENLLDISLLFKLEMQEDFGIQSTSIDWFSVCWIRHSQRFMKRANHYTWTLLSRHSLYRHILDCVISFLLSWQLNNKMHIVISNKKSNIDKINNTLNTAINRLK